MESTDLASVIRRAKKREPQAFETLVDLYANRLFGFLYRLTGSRTDAEDLLQEVFVRVVRSLDGYVHNNAFDGWLFRIATNVARDHIRRAQRSPTVLSINGEVSDETPAQLGARARHADQAPDQQIRVAEQADALQLALHQLPVAEREVIMLRHFSDMSFAAIAEIMGTPLGTALARAHRGLAKLRKIMGAHDGN
jgi:RNA polymerase sigma-70 factor (ECF subfamily)